MGVSGETHIAGHRLAGVLGQGGMGTVYAAHHPRLPRLVALKVLNGPVSADPTFRRRFQREGHLAAGLEHANIVPVYDCGDDHGKLWLSMRLVRGRSAGALLIDQPLGVAPDSVIDIVTNTAEALDFGHRRGVVHRDVKPANILIDTETEHVMLTDFGIARKIGIDDDLTAAGTFIGTFDYCSPEQLSDHDLDGRSDQYGLACMTVQLLTGCKPFQGPTAATVMKQHLVDPPPSVAAMRPGLPVAVDEIFARAMAKRREDRFATCGDFASALTSALHAPSIAVTTINETVAPAHLKPDAGAPPTLVQPEDIHFEFVGEPRQFSYTLLGQRHTVELRQIRATRDLPQHRVTAGDLGGWLADELNLADQAWVGERAWVLGQARLRENASARDDAFIGDSAEVSGTARVDGSASVFADARVSGLARISGNAEITGTAIVSDKAWVYEDAVITDHGRVSGSARVCGHSHIGGQAAVGDYAIITENCRVEMEARVLGHARLSGSVVISGQAVVDGRARVLDTATVTDDAAVGDDAVVSGDAVIGGRARILTDRRVVGGRFA